MKKLIYVLLCSVIVAFTLSSCGGKKERAKVDRKTLLAINPRIDHSMNRTGADTAKVMELSKTYLDLLQHQRYDDAMNMLVEVDAKKKETSPLSSKRRAELMRISERFSFISYSIDEVLFYSDMDTEVRYTITLYEKTPEDGTRPNTMQCALFPRRVNDQWYLTVESQRQERD